MHAWELTLSFASKQTDICPHDITIKVALSWLSSFVMIYIETRLPPTIPFLPASVTPLIYIIPDSIT